MIRKAKAKARPSWIQKTVDYVRSQAVAAITILGALGTLIGVLITVDSFYVRSAAYKADREQAANEFKANGLSQEIATLETREAFTRYRLNDARRAKADDITIDEYRSDLMALTRQLDRKKRMLDELRLGKEH